MSPTLTAATADTPKRETAAPAKETAATQESINTVGHTMSDPRLQAPFSWFDSVRENVPSDTCTLPEWVGIVRSDLYREKIEKIRNEPDKKRRDYLKKQLPAVTFSVAMDTRDSSVPADDRKYRHSGVLQIDVDLKDNPGVPMDEIRQKLMEHSSMLMVATSPSGALKAAMAIPASVDTHKAAFDAAKASLAQTGINIDGLTHDVPRLCFLTHDPDAWLREDPAEVLDIPPPEPDNEGEGDGKEEEHSPISEPSQCDDPDFSLVGTVEDVRFVLNHIPTWPKRDVWLRVSNAVRDAVGEAAAIRLLTEWSPEPEPDGYEKMFKSPLKDVHAGTLVSIAEEHKYDSKAHAREIHNRNKPAGKVLVAGRSKPRNEEIEKAFGPPCICSQRKDGSVVVSDICEPYWAGLYSAENTVLHEPDERAFYKYDPATGLYSPETSDAIKTAVSERLLHETRNGMGDLTRFRRDSRLAAVVNTLKGIVEERGAFTTRPEAVHLANCMLEPTWDGFQRCEFSPMFKSRNRSPIAYAPEATCPRFLGELVEPAVAPDDVVLLQKMIGQALLGRNLVQRFVILDGLAGRGKTQLANVIQMIVGMANCTQLRTHLLNERFEIFRFLHRTLLTGIDVPLDFLSTKGAQALKGLVGGDWMDAEKKGGSGSFQVKGEFNVFVTSNARLKISLSGDESAWRRRLLIVRYEAPPPKMKIPNFAETLVAEEGSGILNWAIDGLGMLLSDIAETGDIALTSRQIAVVDSLLSESESLRHFLRARVESQPTRELAVRELVEAYAEYCPTMGWNPLPITEIERTLPSLMLEMFRTTKANDIRRDDKSCRGFRYVGFKGDSDI